jgi:hypothetical protein
LRDDLFSLFQRLVLLYKNKLSCLEKIESNEIELRYLLRSDNVAGINGLLQEDKEIFIKIDSIAFDIRSLVGLICKTAGIEENNFTEFFLTRDEEPITDIKKLKDKVDKKMTDLIKERDELIKDMGHHLAKIKIDIDSLEKVRELDFKNRFK